MNKLLSAHSLSAQMVKRMVLAALAALLVFFSCFFLGNYLLNQTVYGFPFSKSIADHKFKELQSYAAEMNVTPENLRPLDAWCCQNEEIWLTIYDEADSILFDAYDPAIRGSEYEPLYEDPDWEYSLKFSDGTQSRTFLYYFAGDAYYYLMILFSCILAFIVFSIFLIAFIRKKMRYIERLKSELDILAGGDLSYQVTISGDDEISDLARGIDEMRQSIANHQAAEEQAKLANSALVTAMSHDLRTPLTSLLGYLELMDRGKYEDEKQFRHFIGRSIEKTAQIREMADKLFEYFLVYSSEWEHPDTELADGGSTIQQFWSEYAFSLENAGIQAHCTFGEITGQIRISFELMRRAFDNLYSNIIKHADHIRPVEIALAQKDGRLVLTLTNHIPEIRNKKESTNIGLNTCARIIQYHGGTFSAVERSGLFCVEITLPILS